MDIWINIIGKRYKQTLYSGQVQPRHKQQDAIVIDIPEETALLACHMFGAQSMTKLQHQTV